MTIEAPRGSDRNVLIVAPHFPPATLAGVHRSRHLAKWLPVHGWTPIIIRVDEEHYTETLDSLLAKLVPESVIQERAGALDARITRKMGVTDVGLRSYWAIRTAIAKAVEKHAPKAVLITGSPYYPMLLSGWIKRHFGLPVVLDFQDPWVSAWGETLPKWSKGGIVHRLAVALEPRALRHADYVTSVSDRQNEEMAARHPWLDAKRMAGIPIGGDPEDYDQLRNTTGEVAKSPHIDDEKLNISYVGTFWPRAEPVVRRLFNSIGLLCRTRPALLDRLRLNFIGTSNQPDGKVKMVAPIAESEGIGHFVVETPNRIPFLDALSVLAQSQALMLIGSDEPHYTASKIYPALMSGTPYISLFHAASSAHSILSRSGGGVAIDFDSIEQLDERVPDIADALAKLLEDPDGLPLADPETYADYTANSVAQRYAQIFNEVA